MRKVVLLPDYTGAMGHRLGVGIHMLAAAVEHRLRLINFALLPYRQLFQGMARGPWGSYPSSRVAWPHAAGLLRLFRKPLANWARRHPGRPLGWHYPDKMLDLGSPDFPELLKKGPGHVFWGDQFRSDTLVSRHAEKIREFFRLPEPMRKRAARLVFPTGISDEKVLVVHVRQGDYATWAGGKYCFSETAYARWMRQFQEHMQPNRVRFVICSQFRLDYQAFRGLNFSHQPRDLKLDFAMIQCADYCLASISSFARTACFLAKVPLAAMNSQEMSLPAPSDWNFPVEV